MIIDTNNITIKQVYIPSANCSIYLKEILFESNSSGKIRFNGKPTKLFREEHFEIEDRHVVTDNFYFDIQELLDWLISNNSITEKGEVFNIGFNDISTG